VLWGGLSYWLACPTSNSNALVAGLTGASWAAGGTKYLLNSTLLWTFVVLIGSPLAGFFLAWGASFIFKTIGSWMTPRALPLVERFHIACSALVGAVDGSNDGQLALAVSLVAWGLIQPGLGQKISSPISLRLAISIVMALGVLMGGRRMIKKLGMSFYRLQAIQGVSAQAASAGLIFACLRRGFPVSISQLITGSIVGAGVAKNPRSMKWPIVWDIALSWAATTPAVMFLSALLCKLTLSALSGL